MKGKMLNTWLSAIIQQEKSRYQEAQNTEFPY